MNHAARAARFAWSYWVQVRARRRVSPKGHGVEQCWGPYWSPEAAEQAARRARVLFARTSHVKITRTKRGERP